MAVLVYSIVRRHMRRTSPNSFTAFDGNMDLPVELELSSNETVIGWYRNPAPWEHYLIVFTSDSLYLMDGAQVERIPIKSISGYELPKSKEDVTGVRVLTTDGFRFVRVAGRFGPNGNRKDVYSFIMVVSGLVPVMDQAEETSDDKT